MSFESYHYADVDIDYQPPKLDEPMAPPKGGSGVPSLDSTYIHRIECLETRMINVETKLNRIISQFYGG